MIQASERYCKVCKDKVQDEQHFLIFCPIYKSLGNKFFTLFNKNLNETPEVTVNRILNPCTSQELNNICLFLRESHSLRESHFKNI